MTKAQAPKLFYKTYMHTHTVNTKTAYMKADTHQAIISLAYIELTSTNTETLYGTVEFQMWE